MQQQPVSFATLSHYEDQYNLSGICSYCLKLFGNGVNKQEAGLVNMPKPAPRRMATAPQVDNLARLFTFEVRRELRVK